ncbi:MAG: hypothetical protein LBP33_09820 [Candidatus Adiutrix sp.]|jgi:hypothetical protein|nr:hypothetical protein [Candidatus Adiutrix sp.]
MPIRIALVVSAPRELTLTAGREEIAPSPLPPEDALPYVNIGRAEGDELHLSGALIGDPRQIGASLSVAWYFPDEEGPDQAREVALGEAQIIVNTTPRPKAEPGWRWRYRLESRKPCLEMKFYSGGFQPPFKASSLTLHLQHLVNYNYDGYLLSQVDYDHRPASYIESEWRPPTVEAEGYLQD